MHWRQLGAILVDITVTTGVVLVLVMAAASLGWCISISRLPRTLTPLILATFDNPLMFLLLVNVGLIVVGCSRQVLAAMLILILAPAAASYGIDPVQFGVIVVLNLFVGTITAPMGVVLFVVTRIADIRFETMTRAILPGVVPLLAVLLAITLYPPLTLRRPQLIKRN